MRTLMQNLFGQDLKQNCWKMGHLKLLKVLIMRYLTISKAIIILKEGTWALVIKYWLGLKEIFINLFLTKITSNVSV